MLRIHVPNIYALLFHGYSFIALLLSDCGSLFAYRNSFVRPHDLTTQCYSHESYQSRKGALVTEGQLLTIGTQELLESSRTLLHFVPNPHSDCDQC